MDYKRLEESEQFERYLVLIKELQRVDIESANRDEKLALFLNVHNMMLIHEIVKLGVPGNIWQRRKVRPIISCECTSPGERDDSWGETHKNETQARRQPVLLVTIIHVVHNCGCGGENASSEMGERKIES
jgi:hypothetical protein